VNRFTPVDLEENVLHKIIKTLISPGMHCYTNLWKLTMEKWQLPMQLLSSNKVAR